MNTIIRSILISLCALSFQVTPVSSKENALRPMMPPWKIQYWANENKGLEYEQSKGRYGIIFLHPIALVPKDSITGEIAKNVLSGFERESKWIQQLCVQHKFYFQYFTCSDAEGTHFNQEGLNRIVKELGIRYPVASVTPQYWESCNAVINVGDHTQCGLRVFLIDPNGRIAASTPQNQNHSIDKLQLPPYEQMYREEAEYWLAVHAQDLAKADMAYETKHFSTAYSIYQSIPDKVNYVETGKVIAARISEIENSVLSEVYGMLGDYSATKQQQTQLVLKRIASEFKHTNIGSETLMLIETLRMTKNDNNLIGIVRLYSANAIRRLGHSEDAAVIYHALSAMYPDNHELVAELTLRTCKTFTGAGVPDSGTDCLKGICVTKGVCVTNGELVYAKAVKLLESPECSVANKTVAANLLLKAAEYYTAAICQTPLETSIRKRLAIVHAKLFWLSEQGLAE